MSHFGVVAPAFPSHWRALEALARVLIERGHRVTFFHQPDAATLLGDPDVGFVAVGSDRHPQGSLQAMLRRAARPGGPLGLRRVIQDLATTTDMLCRTLPAAVQRAGVDALLCDQMEAAGGLVADAMQMPYVSVACALPVNREPGIPLAVMPWTYSTTPRDIQIYEASERVYDRLMAPHRRVIALHAQAFGLERRTALHECLSPYAQVSQTVAALDFPRQHLPGHFHHVGPLRTETSQALPPLGLSSQRPFVFASLGTLQGQRFGVLRTIARACRRQGLQLLLAHCGGLSPRQAQALRVPGQVWVTDFAPQQAVLQRADAVVSHAGLNTVMDACAAGTPILALPIAFDQPGVAARVVHAGVGLKGSARWAGAGWIGTALRRLLDEPAFATRARTVGDAVAAAGGATAAADIAEAVVATGRPVLARAA